MTSYVERHNHLCRISKERPVVVVVDADHHTGGFSFGGLSLPKIGLAAGGVILTAALVGGAILVLRK